MSKITYALVLGWVFYSLGYFDDHDRFVLSVQAVRSTDQAGCERLRADAEQDGWLVLPRCVPDEEGAVTSLSEKPGHR